MIILHIHIPWRIRAEAQEARAPRKMLIVYTCIFVYLVLTARERVKTLELSEVMCACCTQIPCVPSTSKFWIRP